MVGRGETQIDLNELNRRFLPQSVEPQDDFFFHGVLLAVAQEMLKRRPDEPARELAIEYLAKAADLAGDCVPT